MDLEERNPQDGVAKTTKDLVNNDDKIEATIVMIPAENSASVCGEAESNVSTETRDGLNLNPSETVLVIDSDELVVKNNEMENVKSKVSEGKENQVVVNVKPKGGKGFNEEWNGERVCRICHLGSNQGFEAKIGTSNSELIQLGCDCKDELGSAHSHCAEAWFKLKGNRTCEICSEMAKNVEGVGDNRFMEEWNEGRTVDSNGNTSNMGGGCWRGQTFCNFLMACLVIAFVLPWFFRINVF